MAVDITAIKRLEIEYAYMIFKNMNYVQDFCVGVCDTRFSFLALYNTALISLFAFSSLFSPFYIM